MRVTDRVPAWSLAVTSIISVQLGLALSVPLFDVVGAAGTAWLRLCAGAVIFLLVNHCVEDAHDRLGPGRLPSMRSIEKEAYVWYNREILTLERAEDYLAREKRRRGELADMKRLLQIRDRSFSNAASDGLPGSARYIST